MFLFNKKPNHIRKRSRGYISRFDRLLSNDHLTYHYKWLLTGGPMLHWSVHSPVLKTNKAIRAPRNVKPFRKRGNGLPCLPNSYSWPFTLTKAIKWKLTLSASGCWNGETRNQYKIKRKMSPAALHLAEDQAHFEGLMIIPPMGWRPHADI